MGNRSPVAVAHQLFVEVQEHVRIKLLELIADLVVDSTFGVERLVAATAQTPLDGTFAVRQRLLVESDDLRQ